MDHIMFLLMVFIKGFYGTTVHLDYKAHKYKAILLICPDIWWSPLRPCVVIMLRYKAIPFI